MYKLVNRQQKIKELLESLPDNTNNKQKIHVIDRTYRHPQVPNLPSTQQSIFNRTLNTLIQNQQQKISESMQIQKIEYCGQVQRRLQNYVYSKTPSRSLDLQTSNKKQVWNFNTLRQQDRVYIERKYNCKLSYQLHNILQATTIEQQSAIMKKRMAQQQKSALISHLERQTKKQVPLNEPVCRQYLVNLMQKSKNQKLRQTKISRKTIQKINATKLSEKYLRPTTINKQNTLKKYIFTSCVTENTSPKK